MAGRWETANAGASSERLSAAIGVAPQGQPAFSERCSDPHFGDRSTVACSVAFLGLRLQKLNEERQGIELGPTGEGQRPSRCPGKPLLGSNAETALTASSAPTHLGETSSNPPNRRRQELHGRENRSDRRSVDRPGMSRPRGGENHTTFYAEEIKFAPNNAFPPGAETVGFCWRRSEAGPFHHPQSSLPRQTTRCRFTHTPGFETIKLRKGKMGVRLRHNMRRCPKLLSAGRTCLVPTNHPHYTEYLRKPSSRVTANVLST